MKLPDFLIIGAPRCGTSTLFHMLCQIPGLWGQPIKELHYFNQHWDKGQQWYLNQFTQAPENDMAFEATPFYLGSDVAPERIKNTLPDVKLVALLREPVARCISHYWWNQDKFGSDPEVLIDSNHHCVKHGHYAEHLGRWYRYFDREQFLIIASEVFFELPAPYTRHIAMRTGISYTDAQAAKFEKTYYDPLEWRKSKYGPPVVSKEVRGWLRSHYKTHNERLRRLVAPYIIDSYWRDVV